MIYITNSIYTNALNDEKINMAENRMSFIKTKMVIDIPFFGIIISKLNTVYDFDEHFMTTDGETLVCSPDFILNEQTSDELLLFMLIHEAFHIAFNHITRKEGKNKVFWNMACDIVINNHIMDLPNNRIFSGMISNLLFDRNFKNNTAEEVYDNLKSFNKVYSIKNFGEDDEYTYNVEGMISSHSRWENIKDNQKIENERFVFIQNTYELTKTHSSTPIIFKRLINDFLSPKQNWRKLLADFVEPLHIDYTFNPPSDMYPTFDFIIPEERFDEDGIKNVYFYVDSSGSIPQALLIKMSSEIKACYEQFGDQSTIYYGDWSAGASEPKLLDNPQNMSFEMSGGTDPTCIFEKLKELDKLSDARAIIVLTDGYFHKISISLAEGVPVLWIIAKGGTTDNLADWDNIIELD